MNKKMKPCKSIARSVKGASSLTQVFIVLMLLILSACQTTNISKTTAEPDDHLVSKITYKRTALSDEELKGWTRMDLAYDSIPGISVMKACADIENKKGNPLIVAIIDSGIDIEHEALADFVWSNEDEIPNNGKDDDGNGYIDDVVGWNFLGDIYFTPMQVTRLVAKWDAKFEGKTLDEMTSSYKEEYQRYQALKEIYNANMEQITNRLRKKPTSYDPEAPKQYVDRKRKYFEYLEAQKEYHYNLESDPRAEMSDDLEDINDIEYGNADVRPRDETETHGTHVAGIFTSIIKELSAPNITFMSIRSTPNGDEYDKDVALAVRYAVDNGASVINMSFGKSYSEHPEWVYDAIQYASENDVLIVHAAGNNSENVDTVMNYPNDHKGSITEIVDNFINVGAINRFYNEFVVPSFSNYGGRNVDIFAPGDKVYSALPNNEYDYQNGTSMAAPVVAAVAALIRSYYPDLSAPQVKRIIMESGIEVPFDVWLEREDEVLYSVPFKTICKSGRILNAFQALKIAEEINANNQPSN